MTETPMNVGVSLLNWWVISAHTSDPSAAGSALEMLAREVLPAFR